MTTNDTNGITDTPGTTTETIIGDLDELRVHLQFAIGLELATIPVYLSALYSIHEGENTEAARVIQSVVVEEMLHMALAANVLNGIGGVPSTNAIDGVSPVPHFPTSIHLLPALGTIHLRPFSRAALDTFLTIEHPAADMGGRPGDGGYHSIGAFYAAIQAGLDAHCPPEVFAAAADDRAGCQIEPHEFYGGAGQLIVVHDIDTAHAAICEIVHQGEGLDPARMNQTAAEHAERASYVPADIPVEDGDVLANGWTVYSHYARFREIATERRYRLRQFVADEPSGDVLPVDWNAVFQTAPDPQAARYAGTAAAAPLDEFNATYTGLIDTIYSAFNGSAGGIARAVTAMWALKYQAIALMKIPSPLPDERPPGHPLQLTLAPPFEYRGTPRDGGPT